MRMRAREAGLNVPDFQDVLHHGRLAEFLQNTPAPWVLKPRSLAGAIWIHKIETADDFWRIVESLGDEQSNFLLEQFIPGAIFHVDTIVYEGEVRFAIA